MAITRFTTICAPCYLLRRDVKRDDGTVLIIRMSCGYETGRRAAGNWPRGAGFILRGGLVVIRALIGLLIVVAVVLFLAKVAVAGGIIGAIALILLVLVLFRVL
jgi:hypothetical protein